MDISMITGKFSRMGARAKLRRFEPTRWNRTMDGPIRVDILTDRHGEYFDVTVNPEPEPDLQVVDIRPADRHLLLKADGVKFLCGHDERHWFVAAIPETAGASNVQTAKEALKPPEVVRAQGTMRLKKRERNRRKNRAFVRQGEWFFIPEPNLPVDEKLALRNEPLVRSNGGKPHIAEVCVRSGGELVYVDKTGTRVLTEAQYARRQRGRNRRERWTPMRRNPGVYVRGKVRHSDHKTIVLDGWHRVVMNTETRSRAMRHVTFLD